MIDADDGRAERLARWIRQLPLADQVHLTGTTLVLQRIRQRRGATLPHPYDEATLREAPLLRAAAAEACRIAALYATAPTHLGPDGVDDHERIVNLFKSFAAAVEARIPGAADPRSEGAA